jgi:glycosyltransferase involved in cell wall biosynthesis
MLLCSDWEGSPVSVKEALACNLPVVATDVGDLREIMRGVPGSRICAQAVADIALSLREVVTASRGRGFQSRSAMVRYDQAATIQKLTDVYQDVLGRRGRRIA